MIAAAAMFPKRRSDRNRASRPAGAAARAERFLLPLQAFADHAAIGVVNVATDQSGTPRAIPMLFRSSDTGRIVVPAARRGAGERERADDRARRPDAGRDGAFRPTSIMSCRSRSTAGAAPIRTHQRGRGAARRRFRRTRFATRIVVIGATVTGGGDFFPTPFDPVMPGVEVIATAIAHLMPGTGCGATARSAIADAVLAVVLPMLLVGLLAWRRNAVGLIASPRCC